MKVYQLIEQLQKLLNKNAEVLIAGDSEMNSINILEEVSFEKGLQFTKIDYQIELFNKNDPEEYGEIPKDGKDCIILFP